MAYPTVRAPSIGSAFSTMSVSQTEKIKRSEEYYLPSGDTIFLVENYLYRVHRFFFERESHYFRQRFSAPTPPGQTPRGSSDSNPFPLDDTLAVDFDRFLWVFYNQKYSVWEANGDQWMSILKLATQWGFPEVTRFAIRELERYEQDPLEKILAYHRFGIDKSLLIPSYIAIVARPEPLSLSEARAFGLEMALIVCRAREYARGSVGAPRGKDAPPRREGARVALDDKKMEELIKELFFSPALDPQAPVPLPHVAAHLASLDGARPLPPQSTIHSRTMSSSGFNDELSNQSSRMYTSSRPGPTQDLSQMWSNPSAPAARENASRPASSGTATAVPSASVPGSSSARYVELPAPTPTLSKDKLPEGVTSPVEDKTDSDSWGVSLGLSTRRKKRGTTSSSRT